MGYFINKDNVYYEGDKEFANDLEVQKRPSVYHSYSFKLKQWVYDEDKITSLKKSVLSQLEEAYKMKTLLNNLTETEKTNFKSLYEKKIKEVLNASDPLVIQDIRL